MTQQTELAIVFQVSIYVVLTLTNMMDSVSLEKGKPFGREIGSEFFTFPRGRDPVRLAEEEPSSRNSREWKE